MALSRRVAFGAGMKVNLRRPAAMRCERVAKGIERHAARATQAEDAIRETDPRSLQRRKRRRAELRENPRHDRRRSGLADKADEAKAELASDRQREPEDHRMQMQVRVAVPIRRRKTKRAKRLELAAYLGAERFAQPRVKRVAQPGANR